MPDNDVQPADLQLAEVRPAPADAARPMTQRALDLLAQLTLAKKTTLKNATIIGGSRLSTSRSHLASRQCDDLTSGARHARDAHRSQP